MNQDINFLGTFADIASVWASYPEGGHEGDYLNIGTVKYRWNKYDRIWENAATVTESTARKLTELYADVLVNNDLRVGGTLYYHRLKGYDMGLYSSLASLQSAHPSPNVGMWAFVVHPSVSGKYQIYMCSTAGEWALSVSETTLDILDFERYEEAVALMQEIANGRALTGYRAAQSVSDLPTEDVDPTLGWIVGNHLYIYVEEGGDTLDGLYQDCGQLRGEKGEKGDKGNDAVVLDGVSLADSIAAVEEAATPSETVPTANATKAVIAEIASAKTAIYGGVITDTADGKVSGNYSSTGTSFIRRNESTGAWVMNAHSSTKYYAIKTGEGTGIKRITGKARFNATPGSYTTFCILSFRKTTPWTSDEWPVEGEWVGLWPGGDVEETRFDNQQMISGSSYYHIAPASMVVGKSSSDRTFDVVPPDAAQSVYIEGYGDSYISITLHKETPVTGHEVRIAALEENAARIDQMAEVIDGGERTETVDGTALVTPTKYYLNGNFEVKNHSSYRRWLFTNKGYTSIAARVGMNAALESGMCAVAFHNGTEWSVPDDSYILRTSVGMRTFETDIPSGTTQICVCHRNSAGTPSISLIREWEVDPIETRVETLEEKVEAISGDGKDMMTRHETRDQDSLMLRNHIKTQWPYFFAAAGTGYDNQPYLDRKIAQIPDGKHFIFVTDTHWGTGSTAGNPSKNSTYIASYVSKRLGGCPVIFGGDCINSEDSEYNAAMRLSQYADEFFAAFGDNGLWVQGNHDNNKEGTGVPSDVEIYKRTTARLAHKVTFDEETIAKIWEKDSNGDYVVGDMTEEDRAEAEAWMRLHYHWDDDRQKIRFIVYETGCCGATLRKFIHNVTYSFAKPSQYAWLYKVLLSVPEDYDIVLMGHMLPDSGWTTSGTDGGNMMTALRTFRRAASCKMNTRINTQNKDGVYYLKDTPFRRLLYGTSSSKTLDFSSSTFAGRIFCVSGHFHRDTAFLKTAAENPVPYSADAVDDASVLTVNVNVDNLLRNDDYYPDRADTALGTVGEVSFDVITLTDDDKVVCTRIGYYDGAVCSYFNENGERVFRLTPEADPETEGIDASQAE